MEELFSADEVREYLMLTERQFRDLLAKHKFYIKHGHSKKFTRRHVKARLEAGECSNQNAGMAAETGTSAAQSSSGKMENLVQFPSTKARELLTTAKRAQSPNKSARRSKGKT